MPAQNAIPFEDRMRTIKHGVLARPVLERVIRETDFFPDLRDDMDEAVARLRRQVEVRLEGEVPAGAPALLFVVEVHGRDADKVARAATLLPEVYGEMTRDVFSRQARSLRETLDAQVEELAKVLAGKEAGLVAFKTQHASELPEMIDDNARAVGRAQALLELRLGLLAEARRRRSDVLASIPEGPSAPGMAEAALDGASRRLAAAQAAYGPNHPDVRRAKREYQEALARRDQEGGRFRDERVGQQLARIDEDVAQNEEAVAASRREMAAFQQRVDAAPRWGQELANLTRDYEALKARYGAALARRADAASAEALLAKDQPTMFRVVDAPVKPERPSAPDRGRLAWLAVLAALAAGLGAAALAEWLDATVRGPEDAGSLGVPVLAAIPRIGRIS
jgi:uncharacterized protein involved in exopolysaccharide biosynthesis